MSEKQTKEDRQTGLNGSLATTAGDAMELIRGIARLALSKAAVVKTHYASLGCEPPRQRELDFFDDLHAIAHGNIITKQRADILAKDEAMKYLAMYGGKGKECLRAQKMLSGQIKALGGEPTIVVGD